MAVQILLPASSLPLVFHFFKVYFSALSSYTTDRNYVFLLCNVILVLIVAISGPTSSSETNQSDYDKKKDKTELQSAPEISTRSSVGGNEVALESENTKSIVQSVEEGEVIKEIIDGSHGTTYREDEMLLITDYENIEEEETDSPITNGECMLMLSTEELNKKCEEFIRKMREEIKNEETSQLIMTK